MGRPEHDSIFGTAHAHVDGKVFVHMFRMTTFDLIVQGMNQAAWADNVTSEAQNMTWSDLKLKEKHRVIIVL